MSDQQLLFRIALTMIPNIGPQLARHLVGYCGGTEAVFREKKARLARIPGVGEKLATTVASFKDFDRAEQEITFLRTHHIQPLFYLDDTYPWRLKQQTDSPVLLYFSGTADLNAARMVNIIGTRKASEYGKQFTAALTAQLLACNCTIVSGMAYGIDIAAHKAALANNIPTIGVLAHGLDRLYPAAHVPVAQKMLQNGGLLTEYTSLTNPDRENFPMRNRIVAGMCDATIVIETARKGGAMITAALADSYNRDVFAVPGKPRDAVTAGCNYLIKSHKAALLETADDLKYLMGWDDTPVNQPLQRILPVDLNELENKLLAILAGKTQMGIDELCAVSYLSAGETALTLLELEFKGLVKSLPGKQFQLG